ncbi:MAG TPA: DUF4304 domain-containing protein [Candidatus Limnocylindria bacterium]|jgi:hypothetical protein|nr:DUF4304 domain-containing protein [Candidatus Limnocylindria bacterium]HEV8654089.1 DUF4304 domain-containing protein [Candidatus Limnocylindria bacterium]
MTRGIALEVDRFLTPLGFERKESAWNRRRNGLIDVVSLQVDGVIEKLTLEAGVLHPAAYTNCWEKTVPEFVDTPECTVRARVGHLINGHDHWWALDQAGISEEVVDSVARHLLPYLDRHQSAEALEETLTDSGPVKHLRPPETVYLAILKWERADFSGACALLAEFQKKAIGDWKPSAVNLMQRLGCQLNSLIVKD